METYSSKKINDILNYSRMLVDSLSDGVKDELSYYKYLIFAGMIKYYGREYIDDIYRTFQKSSVIKSKDSILNSFSKYLCIEESVIEEVSGLEPIAYLSPSVFVDEMGHLIDSKKNIYVSFGDSTNMDILFALTSEYNKVLNSVNRSIGKDSNGSFTRRGVSTRRLGGDSSSRLFEDAINFLQTEDIVREIVDFSTYDISDDELRCSLDTFSKSLRGKYYGNLEAISELVRPLYDDSRFNGVLKISRLNGTINNVKDEFDKVVGNGSFDKMCDAVDSIGFSGCPEYIFEINGGTTQDLVKQYVKH